MSALEKYRVRFPIVEFKKNNELKIQGLPAMRLKGINSTRSPIRQYSPWYSHPPYNISELCTLQIDNLHVSLTVIVIPPISVPKDSFVSNVLHFGGIICAANKEFKVTHYAALQLHPCSRNPNRLVTQETEVVVNISGGFAHYSLNTSNFVFYTDAECPDVTDFIVVRSCRRTNLVCSKYVDTLHLITKKRFDKAFVDRLHDWVKQELSKELQDNEEDDCQVHDNTQQITDFSAQPDGFDALLDKNTL